MTGHMSKFALLCQASRLLGQVLRHVSSDVALHDNVWIQLDRTLQSMLAASLDVENPDNDQISFVYRYELRSISNLSDHSETVLLLLCICRGCTLLAQAQLAWTILSAHDISSAKSRTE